MSSICTTINAGLNASPGDIAAAVNTFLAGANPISIVSINHYFVGRTGEQIDIKLCYKAGGAQYTALVFQGDDTSSADTKANASFAANPAYRAPYILDISNPYRRNLLRDVALVLAITDFSIDIQANRYMAIVDPTAPIAAGATGTVTVQGSSGALPATISVTNRFSGIWSPGAFGWAALDPATGLWDGTPSCC